MGPNDLVDSASGSLVASAGLQSSPTPAAARYSVRYLTTVDDVDGIRADWESCRRRQTHLELQHRPEWFEIASRADGDLGRGALVVAISSRGELIGVAPFLLRPWRWRCRVGYRTIAQFPITLAQHVGDTLLAPGTFDDHEALLLEVSRAPSAFQMIFFECLPERALLWKVIHASKAVRKKFWVYVPSGMSTRRMIHLTSTFEGYLQKMNGKTRKNIRRSVEKLDEVCDKNVTVRCVTSRAEIPQFLHQVHQISALSWQGRQLGAVMPTTPTRIEQFSALADCGWLRSYLLCCSGQPIAFVLGWQADGTYYYEQVGFDPAWAKFSPGIVLLYRMLEDLFANDAPQWVDFRYGDNQYKRVFSTDSFVDANVYLVRKRLYPTCVMLIDRLFTATTRMVRTVAGGLGVTARLRHLLRGRLRENGRAAQEP